MCNFEQCLQSLIDWRPQSFQSEFREDPILSYQWDGVSNGGNGNYFHERHQQPRLIGTIEPHPHQCLRKFEGDPRAAQRFAGIVTARLVGVEHCQCGGNAIVSWKVMVGYDEVHTQTLGSLSGGK